MPRQARLDAPGILHHVIVRGIEKGRIVDDDKDRENFVSRLGNRAVETDTRIYAWSLNIDGGGVGEKRNIGNVEP